MVTGDQLLQIIENEIKNLSFVRNPKELYQPIQYILSLGGKRIRPTFTLLSCTLFSDDYKPAMPAAIALEIFHNFTLIHDDIMDNAALRRGKPTIHSRWNSNVAILSGDAMNIFAYHVLTQTEPDKLLTVLPIFNDTALKVCEGQQYDMDFEQRNDVSVDEYIKMIELKTGALIAACHKIGALIGGADTLNAEALYLFGLNMGIAFQLQDDLLDVFGDENLTGKEIGKDILSNKKTYLLIKALNTANTEQKIELDYWLQYQGNNFSQKIESVKNIFNQLKIEEVTKQAIENYAGIALQNLQAVKVPEERKKELLLFFNRLNHRSF
jgi:geranylgeranyl diphosphate synthase type II